MEIVAILQGFVFQDPSPEIAWKRVFAFPLEGQSRNKHGDFLSNGRATGAPRRKSPARNASHSDAGGIWDFRGSAAGWVADGTRTRNSQNHNLELYQLSYNRHENG